MAKDPEQPKQSRERRTEFAISQSFTSGYPKRLQSSKLYVTDTKTGTQINKTELKKNRNKLMHILSINLSYDKGGKNKQQGKDSLINKCRWENSFPDSSVGKECLQCRRCRFDPRQEDPLEEAQQPTRAFLPGESHGQKRLAGHSQQYCKESDTTEATEHVCSMHTQKTGELHVK